VPLPDSPADAVAAVVIGRNEGARLIACLDSLAGRVARLVYVDSGSTDGSAAAARARGAEVVDLDLARPFTAARARNAGLDRLRETGARPVHVQFVDGDCSVVPGWIETARAFLDSHPEVAAVCGRRRERHPEASVYNRLCDWEWDTPVGEAKACGGDALIRTDALEGIGGYRDDVIAAEDDEMCQRLRKAGWKIWRIDAEMTMHDAALLQFKPWWRRALRAGHGFAQVGDLHPGHFDAARRRTLLWGGAMPLMALAGMIWWWPLAVAVLALYAISWLRILRRFRAWGMGRQAGFGAALMVLSKFPGLQGMALWYWRRVRHRTATIIEYK